MKLKLYLKSSARYVLLLSLFLFIGCSTSTTATFSKEKIASAIQGICKKEYDIDLVVTLAGETLWVYLPTNDIVVKTDKPRKFTNLFEVGRIVDDFSTESLKLRYSIKNIPPETQYEATEFNKKVSEKMFQVLQVIRRVLFSLDRDKKEEPRFICVVVADVKNGVEITTLSYYPDLKKVSYGIISVTEYQHRNVQDVSINPDILGDKKGRHLKLKDIAMKDFIASQIRHRIKLKFQKPELGKNADIDKEVLKIIALTVKIYGFNDFHDVELENSANGYQIRLNKVAVLEKTSGDQL